MVAIKVFDVGAVLYRIKHIVKVRIEKRIKNDILLAEDTLNDHNKIEGLMFLSFGLKTLKLVIMIANISYFLGMFWMVFCRFFEEELATDENTFLQYYGLLERYE